MSRWVAIVDYGMGNLYSVLHACKSTGIEAEITSDPGRVLDAHAVILPGVGAFGDAMRVITERNLLAPLQQSAASGKPFVGICLGMQLMMQESHEFGMHRGLGLFEGDVRRIESPTDDEGRALKVPEVGWNAIHRPAGANWEATLLSGIADGTPFYFVHSFYCAPASPDVVASTSRYGQLEYCSTVSRDNLFGCQYHPERSGPHGLAMYRNLAKVLNR